MTALLTIAVIVWFTSNYCNRCSADLRFVCARLDAVTPSLLCESDPTNSYNPWANTTTSPDFTLTEMSCIRKLPVMGASLH